VKQVELVPNQKYRILGGGSVPNVSILAVTFNSQTYYNKVLKGERYNKYAHHERRYSVPVLDNVFKAPDFKVINKTVFFITPNISISAFAGTADGSVGSKEKEKEKERDAKVAAVEAVEGKAKGKSEVKGEVVEGKSRRRFSRSSRYRGTVPRRGKKGGREGRRGGGREKPHVAIFNAVYGRHPFGGPAVYGYNVVSMLAKANIDFKMFYSASEPPHQAYVQGCERFLRPLSEFNSDDFNVFYVMNGISMLNSLTKKNISPIIVGSNIVPNSLPAFCSSLSAPVINDKKERAFAARAEGVFWLAQSHYQEREYRRLGLPWGVPIFIAPNPVNTDMFRPDDKPKDVEICWTGKNTWAKGIPILKHVVATNRELRFLIISENIISDIAGDNIRWRIGKTIFELKDVLPTAKLFLTTSYKEFQPLAMLEAMSCGLPPIGFKTSGIDEIIRDGYNGITVDCFGLDHLQIAIDTILKNDDLRVRMGKKAREYVVVHHGYEACAKSYKELFKRAVKMGGKKNGNE